ncbi:MAG: phosphotransferase, partial [Dehalococcoidia bacterium]
MPSSSPPADPPVESAVALDQYARAIAAAFPSVTDCEPLSLLGETWYSVVVETGGGVVFRFPKQETGAQAQVKESRLLPFLRSHLTPAVPVPDWRAQVSEEVPWGFMGYRRLTGMALHADAINDRNVDRLAGDIAQFLSELHAFPVDRAQALEVPGPRGWKAGFERLRRDVMPPLRQRLLISEFGKVRRWWAGFLGDSRSWDFQPALVHAEVTCDHLLVDAAGRGLSGVVGWRGTVTGDPAADFV